MVKRAIVLALAACGHGPSTPHSVEPIAAAPPRPSSAELCGQLLDTNAHALATVRPGLVTRADASRVDKLAELLHVCKPGRDGAWTLTLDDVNDGMIAGTHGHAERSAHDPDAVFARLALAHHFADGREVKICPTLYASDPCDATVNFTVQSERDVFDLAFDAFDFDGDGTPEVILHLTRGGLGEDSGDDVYSVWSLASGKIVPFPPLAHTAISSVLDVDGDGRPDVVTTTPYSIDTRFPYADACLPMSISLPLLLHTGPRGTFVGDDRIAQDYARDNCGQLVTRAFAQLKTSDDGYRWAACQRMAGRSEADVLGAFAQRCVNHPPDPCGGLELCDNADVFHAAATIEPPLRFSE